MKHGGASLDAGWRQESIDFAYVVRLLLRQFLPLTLAPMLIVFLGISYIVIVSPRYTSTALLRLEAGGLASDELSVDIASHMTSIASLGVTSQVIERLNLADEIAVEPGRLDRLVNGLRERFGGQVASSDGQRDTLVGETVLAQLWVQRVGESTIISVGYTADTPQRAADIANAYADVYVEEFTSRLRKNADRTAAFLRTRVADLERLAAESFREVHQIRAREGAELGVFEDLDALLARFSGARSEIEGAEFTIAARLSLLENVESPVSLEAAAFPAEGGPAILHAYREALDRLQSARDRGLPPDFVGEAEAAVANLRRELEILLSRERIGLQQEQRVLAARRESMVRALDDALEQSGQSNHAEMLISEHRAGVFQTIYADHLRRLETVYERAVNAPIAILSRAQPGPGPSSPNSKAVLAVSVAFGLSLGLAIAMLREWGRSRRVFAVGFGERPAP